jgi:prepilin-type N-terminal cleavage/methylation domain-containing protein
MEYKTRNWRLGEAGFTLVELIITIVLVGIIAGIAAILTLQGVSSYTVQDLRADLTNQGRLAIERMAREIRAIRQTGEIGTTKVGATWTISGNPTSSLIFTDLTGTDIIYSLSGSMLNRTMGGVDAAMADGVTTLQFNHYDRTGALTTTPADVWQVQIDLTVTRGGESQDFRIRVHPRNFM